MRLLLDIGNSRLKWALADDSGLGECGALAHGGDAAAALVTLDLPAVGEIWVAQVMGAVQQALAERLQQRLGVPPQFAASTAAWHGLHNAYAEPQRLGIDRWLVMIAAWAESPVATVVVDAGTALTVDVIDGNGDHRGGLIAAGLHAQWAAVRGHTRFENRDGGFIGGEAAGLGRDTESCVRQGAMLACLGAIDRAAATAGSEARCLITGGDAAQLLPWLPPAWEHRPQLVLEGLNRIAMDR